MAKSRDAFRTISEVSTALDTPTHVLRFWESKFAQIKPVKRAGGRRYYRPEDVDLLAGIKTLLHDQGMTIKGAQKLLKEQGVNHVIGLGGETDEKPLVTQDVDRVAAPEPLNAIEPTFCETSEAVAPESAAPALKMPTAQRPEAVARVAILSDIAIPNQIMISKNAAKIAPLLAKLEALRNRMQVQ